MKGNQSMKAEHFDSVTVYMSDIVNFNSILYSSTPSQVCVHNTPVVCVCVCVRACVRVYVWVRAREREWGRVRVRVRACVRVRAWRVLVAGAFVACLCLYFSVPVSVRAPAACSMGGRMCMF